MFKLIRRLFMKTEPNYYALIPAKVRYDNELSANAKLLYGEITSLTNKEGVCWATNQYFADLYHVSLKTIQRWLRQLEEAEYVVATTEVSRLSDGTVRTKRYLSVDKNVLRGDKNVLDRRDNFVPDRGYKNVAQNNINNINNKINNNNITKVILAKAIENESTETHGKPEINEAFEFWEKTLGFKQKNTPRNRNAAYNLVRSKEIGPDNLKKLVQLIASSQQDRYAPREVREIVDFSTLQRNKDALIMWARRAFMQGKTVRKGLEI